jgi:hypothetical protein
VGQAKIRVALILFLAAVSPALPAQSADALTGTANTDFRSSVRELQAELGLIKATLARNKVEFPGRTGPISGFAAGSAYPQIWLRDAATILPASRLFYDAPFLSSWLVEHLAFQKKNGALEDWIDSRGKSDKNTVETDQETSAVRAAAEIVRVLGPEWLQTTIGGETVLCRLERALRWVVDNRFDRERGLVKGAHTADWGDVEMNWPDQRAIYADAGTHWTCDIYDQAQFHGAAIALAGMLDGAGAAARAAEWRERAAGVKSAANRWLWQAGRGFFRVHIHIDALKHGFDEDAMFPMGGNAEAALAGLASDEQCGRIFAAALDRQREYKISTISGGLLPPYPKGTFKHPMVDDPYEYQNGGQWDWFGAKLVKAMFDRGSARTARAKLVEIAAKNSANKGLYEWDTPDGQGRGSAFYSGSAGSLALALIEGYFGVVLDRGSLRLEPKLAEDRASVSIRIPAAGVFAAYEHSWDAERKALRFRYSSDVKKPGTIRLLLPSALSGKKPEVLRDGKRWTSRIEKRGEDSYVVVETDFLNHVLEIR